MNVKAERIEQMIQVINRNLQLVFSGQIESITPLEMRQLQRVDAVIFGHDKFAFEMVHFLKASLEQGMRDSSLSDIWETNFVQGLESLLVECAVVNDDIERDCFVSRVYCWFTEKLTERRELPRKVPKIDQLKASIERSGGNPAHYVDTTQKGLDAVKVNNLLENTTHRVDRLMDGKESERDLPLLTLPNTTGGKPLSSSNGNFRKAAPVYVKHGFPTILKPSTSSNGNHSKASPYHHLLPKMPGTADDSYGMIYNKPETEAERTMNELWLARRRQEAFEWKTQQHLALVMDRLALHKSRLESDALRKQEYTFLMKNSKMRPSSAPIAHHTPSDKDALAGPPIGSRGMSGTMDSEDRDRSHPRMLRNLSSDEYSLSPRSASPGRHHSRRTRFKKLSSDPGSESDNYAAENATRRLDRLNEGNTSTVVVSEHGSETVSNIARPSRISVAKQPPQVTKLPMRFKVDRPEDYSTQQKVYMQLSDSDDDDIPDRPIKSLKSSKGIKKPSTAKKGPGPTAPPAPATFKHERPVVRERPVSAKMFHVISTNDPEFKVHYRHSNYRRMPLTEKQEMWLDEQEMHRIHVSEESAKKLVDQYTAKMEKAKGKGKDKKAEKKDKGEKGKESKKKGDTVKVEEEKVKPKYKSASHFMATQFPNFEDDDDFDTQGPMRTIQLLEVAQIMDVCDEYDVKIKESAVRKALLIPQDRPEAICLENLRSEKEGLMINPNPREFWRKFTAKKGGKKGKKKKKKA